MTILYILIYWVVSAFVLLMPTIFDDVNKKLTWKNWVPTFILAPLIFPFYMIMMKHKSGLFGVEHKVKPTEKQKKKNENTTANHCLDDGSALGGMPGTRNSR